MKNRASGRYWEWYHAWGRSPAFFYDETLAYQWNLSQLAILSYAGAFEHYFELWHLHYYWVVYGGEPPE